MVKSRHFGILTNAVCKGLDEDCAVEVQNSVALNLLVLARTCIDTTSQVWILIFLLFLCIKKGIYIIFVTVILKF